MTQTVAQDAHEFSAEVAKNLDGSGLEYEVRDRPDGPYLLFLVAHLHERFFRALSVASSKIQEVNSENIFLERVSLATRKGANQERLALPEVQLLRSTLSQSLTVDRYSYGESFGERYIQSVFNYENQIVADANFLVYGRRGSGKSSLLAYAMRNLESFGQPFAWVSLQAYSGRADSGVTADCLFQILQDLSEYLEADEEAQRLKALLSSLSEATNDVREALSRIIPKIGRLIRKVAEKHGVVTIFLDDLHVLDSGLQSGFLADLYAVSRGNMAYLKISGIEQFCHPWSSSRREGLEIPQDAQLLKLDYNLTMPGKSKAHIQSILDAHAEFCGLPSISYISGGGVMSRLVWVAAAVPRDALSLYAQAITKALAKDQKRVSITSINAAASETAEQKLRDIENDRAERSQEIKGILDQVKAFCVQEKKKNAFLLEIKNGEAVFEIVQELVALRLVHVLHEGITPNEAGRRYQALMLDYGFYVGIRAAKSVDLFQGEPETPTAKELRGLPVFQGRKT